MLFRRKRPADMTDEELRSALNKAREKLFRRAQKQEIVYGDYRAYGVTGDAVRPIEDAMGALSSGNRQPAIDLLSS